MRKREREREKERERGREGGRVGGGTFFHDKKVFFCERRMASSFVSPPSPLLLGDFWFQWQLLLSRVLRSVPRYFHYNN